MNNSNTKNLKLFLITIITILLLVNLSLFFSFNKPTNLNFLFSSISPNTFSVSIPNSSISFSIHSKQNDKNSPENSPESSLNSNNFNSKFSKNNSNSNFGSISNNSILTVFNSEKINKSMEYVPSSKNEKEELKNNLESNIKNSPEIDCNNDLKSWCEKYILNYDLPQKQTYGMIYTNNRFAIDGEKVWECNGDKTKPSDNYEMGTGGKLQGTIKDGKITWQNFEPKTLDMKYAYQSAIAIFDKKDFSFVGVILLSLENSNLNKMQLIEDDLMTLEEIEKCEFIRLKLKSKEN